MLTEAVYSFAEFKSLFDRAQVNIADQRLRKSYQELNQLRKHKNLSWQEVGEKVHALGNELHMELLKSGELKASQIPLTERDWERIG
jgi:hypothetical protein